MKESNVNTVGAVRTSVNLPDCIFERVKERIKETEETFTEYVTRALVNQLENDGDYEIRDEMEVRFNGYEKITHSPSDSDKESAEGEGSEAVGRA